MFYTLIYNLQAHAIAQLRLLELILYFRQDTYLIEANDF